MRLAIIGIQGSGKGTQAKLIAKEFRLKRISVGKILRDEIKKGSRRGKVLAKYIDKGDLAPNRIVNKIVLENLPKDNFIVDGFPRDKKQLKVAKKVKFDKVILLTLYKQSPKIIKFFGDKIIKINGSGSIKKVFGEIKKKLK